MEYFMNTYGWEILGLIMCAIAGSFARFAKRIWTEKVNTSTKREVAYSVFRFVEQVWKVLKGEAKMQKALEKAREILEKKGIDFDADEMRVLIEVCVAEFNSAFKTPLQDPASADAVTRVDGTVADDNCGLIE